jgi:3-hydroxyacyl-CoA dehydrogenase
MIETRASDGICIVRLCAPPLNTLSFELLDQLAETVQRINRDAACRGAVVIGDSEHFSAGADVGLFRQIETANQAIETSQRFQRVFGQLEDSPKPIVAALAGTVVGGALELAAACHYRVAAADCRFRMPEVNLGINPGAGGTQRLPRLVGLEPALRMLLTGETIDAARALELGLIDAVCPADELPARAVELLADDPPPIRTSQRTDRISADRRGEAFEAAERMVAQARSELIAPRKILDTVRIGVEQSFANGLASEQTSFAECMDTLAVRNKIRMFFATSETSKLPELADVTPRPLERAAVIGMGTMGTGIVHALALAGMPVVALDRDSATLQSGFERIAASLDKRVKRGKLDSDRAAQILALIETTCRWEELAGADLVIESVFEDADVKAPVLYRAEELCADDAILATNTSTISLNRLAAGLRRPERLIGMHFFNPAQRMPLVEVIRQDATPPEILVTITKLAKRMRKTPVVVANREGFLVNRIFVPYLQEAFALLEDGAAPREIDDAAEQFGFPMGPLVLIDMAGIDILVDAQRVLADAISHHGRLSAVASRLVALGHLGQKAGAGVYRYEPGDFTPRPSEATARVIAEVQAEQGRTPRRIDRAEITERLVLRMVNEAFYVVQEGVARNEVDVDVAMVLGTGFPDFRGGVMKYAADTGLDSVLSRLESLNKAYGERFSPCHLLRQRKGAD